MIHPVVAEVLSTRRVRLADGTSVEANSFIPRDSCELLYDVVRETNASRTIEVGMAYGVSTVCLADALRKVSGERAHHVVIDPVQTRDWGAGGIAQVARAGLSDVVEVIELPSHVALPQLLARGERVQAAFIDGWHTFDHTLIDFFYIDQMLERGGIVVFDDVGYPAIHSVVRFVLANRAYELAHALHFDDPAPAALKLRRSLKRALRPLARTDRDPAPRLEPLFRSIATAHTVALKKLDDDTRRFDHYAAF